MKESLMACEEKGIKIIITFFVSSTFKLCACNLQVATTEVKNKTKKSQAPQNPQNFVVKTWGFLG